MKRRVGKAWFFIVVLVIAFLTYTSFWGISSTYGDNRNVRIKGALNEGYEGDGIRWGIDIRGGVDVTFRPTETSEGSGVYNDVTPEELESAAGVIKNRLVNNNITDHEVYIDANNDRIIVRYPWKEGDDTTDVASAIKELGSTASLTFRGGQTDPSGEVILDGEDISNAYMAVNTNDGSYEVGLELTSDGAQKFSTATANYLNDFISIYLDDECISAPRVNAVISDGRCSITGDFTAEEATNLASLIKSGSMPVELETDTFGSINPTLGDQAKTVTVIAGLIGLVLVIIFVIAVYRLPGVIAAIAIIGQLAGTIACITGYFGGSPGFTLTLPGIAGIILSIGMGVDANVVTSERIKEELRAGRTLDGAIQSGFKGSFWAIFDGNITTMVVAMILMGVFGAPDSFFAKVLSPILRFFGTTASGSIYSFGYTLLIGVLLNFIMGVFASRLMIKSISRFKAFRNPWLYGGEKK
ncbi:MAG: SecD/SecF family protein translocase subunit [Clostridia bacterium]|nr:SecD/SecF family protein translocase subunit [Clostridia bacterium]